MNGGLDEPGADDTLARPYLARAPGVDRAGAPASLDPGLEAGGRPYLLTRGRTRSPIPGMALETLVVTTERGSLPGSPAELVERRRMRQLCLRPMSVAEVAARLRLPLQVTLVIIGDLVAEGLLQISAAQPQQARDVPFLERLIAGVAAL